MGRPHPGNNCNGPSNSCRTADQVTIFTRNLAAVQAIHKPNIQSGQVSITQIYDATRTLRGRGCSVRMVWCPAENNDLVDKAKKAARKATAVGSVPTKPFYQARSTVTNRTVREQGRRKKLPAEVGKYTQKMDTALPGTHTKGLYNALTRPEAIIQSLWESLSC